MEKVKLIDLRKEHLAIQEELEQAMLETIEESQFINGEGVKRLSERLCKYLNVKYTIPCANGTDAIQLALMALELPNDSEIIIPTFNYVSALEISELLGFKSILCDVDPTSFNVTIDHIEKVISQSTRAIIIPHLFGQCVDISPIVELAHSKNIWVIEDVAQALGAEYLTNDQAKKAGTLADIATTSFYPTKVLGCLGDGGALFTDNQELANKIKLLSNHGQSEKFNHSLIGINSRLDSLQAAILNVKLKHLDNKITQRQRIASIYNDRLSNNSSLSIPHVLPNSTHIYYQYSIQTDTRKRIIEQLKKENIPFEIHYPLPLHLQEAYKALGYKRGDFPNAEKLCDKVLGLPMHPELSEEQIHFICDSLEK